MNTDEKIIWENFFEWSKDKAFVNDEAFVASWTMWKERQKEIDSLQETIANLVMARMRTAQLVKYLESEVERLKK
jgi:hypothetical protein